MKRVDERDMMFSRMSYAKGTDAYEDYYIRNPEKKDIDDDLRSKPQLYAEGKPTFDALLSPAADANFALLTDMKKLCEGKPTGKKCQVDADEITQLIKKLALHYGAQDVGIAYADDEFYYSHRGRRMENYGDAVDTSLKNAIVFTVEMKQDIINTAPQVSAGLEASKAYVAGAIVGLQLAYYIRSLGYNARCHMDGNYLMPCIPIAEQAGLGQRGRNNLLISRKNGCFCRIGIVTTDMPLVHEVKKDYDLVRFCKLCGMCIKTCPAKTIPAGDNSDEWHIEQEKCFEIWTSIGNDCGVCISSCPIGQDISLEAIKDMSDKDIEDFVEKYKEKYGTRKRVTGKYFK
ncbi:MAG: reductive dehalogenase domain-containing protein [Eubacteriales bacterium]